MHCLFLYVLSLSIYNQANEKVLLILSKSYESISRSHFTLKTKEKNILLLLEVVVLIIIVVVGTLYRTLFTIN